MIYRLFQNCFKIIRIYSIFALETFPYSPILPGSKLPIRKGRHALIYYLQSRISGKFGVDVHPVAKIGKDILINHTASVVIGETAVVKKIIQFFMR
jgi:serine acetyltransferase